MPIYEYQCGSCGHHLEAWQKISEKPKKVCPECKARQLERLISSSSFQLKGSGWYVTDYAKGSSGGGKSSKKSSDADSGDTSSSSSDSASTSTASDD